MPAFVIHIPHWHPSRVNQLYSGHWSKRRSLKRLDLQMIDAYGKAARVPVATGKRRVSLLLVMAPGQRRGDVDAYWKSVLDSLVHSKLLVNDSPNWCEIAPVTFDRGLDWGTSITLTDL